METKRPAQDEDAAVTVRPAFRPATGSRGPEAGELILRDGSRRPLLRALPEDAARIFSFYQGLPEVERRSIAESLQLDPSELGRFLEGIGRAGVGEAYIVQRGPQDERLIAFGAYRVTAAGEVREVQEAGETGKTGEVREAGEAGEAEETRETRQPGETAALTLAVAPEARGSGLAGLLLEQLGVLAAQRGVDQLMGIIAPGAEPVREILRSGGFRLAEQADGDREVFRTSTRAPELRQEMDRMAARVFTAASMHTLFYPRSVAVVGASRSPGAVGHRILKGITQNDFNGPVYPVNPRADHVRSIRCYPSVSAIGEPVDLAVIAVPAEVVPDVVDDCAEAGVRGLVVITAGYAETGEDGRHRQTELLEQARNHGMRMVGPNCLGLIHTDPEVRLNASFAPEMPPTGRVGLCSQSGALGIAIIALARQLGLGLSSFVSIGNKADISGNDLLEYWEQDPNTDVALLYLESFGNPRRFARLARRVGRSKPIVVVKAGRTEAGERAASSHTAALAAAETAVEALLRQTGIIRADTLVEMFGIARALVSQPLPRGRRAAIVTNAGGPGILCVDALVGAGLDVPTFSDRTRAALREFLPPAASTTNPVDMIAAAGPEEYRRAVETVLAADEVDALVVIYTPVGIIDTAEIGRAVAEGVRAARARGHEKPTLAVIVGEEAAKHALSPETGAEEIPIFPFPEEIGRILGKITDYAEWRRSDPGFFREFSDQDLDTARATCRDALTERGAGWLSASEARTVLDAAGLQIAPGGLATSADQAAAIAERIGYPVAVKLVSLEIVHKTEIGAVKLDLEDADAVRSAFEEIGRRLEGMARSDAMQGVLVQPMLEGTAEVMIGVNQDPVFGPLIAFGLGGIHVEVLRDVAFRVAPLTDHDASEMTRQIRGFRLLEGYRGHPAADIAALEEALQKVSRLVEACPAITEIDLNPIFALEPGQGYRIVDARIRVDDSGTR